jgi:hypothetical protein
MAELAQQLLETARAGKVKWEEGLKSDSYRANLPDISLVITRTNQEDYRLDLINDKGRIIESIASGPLLPSQVRQTMEQIHEIARRSVLAIDQNIDKALEYLRRV